MFRQLDPDKVIATIAQLRDRVKERFATASLGNVADELLVAAKAHAARSARIRRPSFLVRGVSALLVLLGAASLLQLLLSIRLRVDQEWRLSEAVQTLESGLSTLFFLGVTAVFLLSLDLRRRRRRCLAAVHEMRAMAHIVDMHQLTKDPDRVSSPVPNTASSPLRSMSRAELARYLDYCSEMLSLMGKVAALYVQSFPDPQAMAAVDDVENLTTGLSGKIWQKIMILEQSTGGTRSGSPAGS